MSRLVRLLLLSILVVTFVTPMVASAQVRIDPLLYPEGSVTFDKGKDAKIEDVDRYTTEGFRDTVVFRVTSVILSVAGLLAVFFIVINGFGLVISTGEEGVVTQRKKGLTWGVVGLLLVILSYSIISFVINLSFKADQEKTNDGSAAAAGGAAGAVAGTSSVGGVGAGAGARVTPRAVPERKEKEI